MPELPEVETIARGLSRALGAQAEILEIVVGRADYVRSAGPGAAAALAGRRVRAITRHGKRLEIECDPPGRVLVHLGMSGQLTVTRPGDPREDHTHFVVRLATSAGPREIRLRDPRRFGGVWLDPTGEDGERVAVSGPSRRGGGETDGRTRSESRPDSGARNGARPGGLGPDALAVDRPAFRALLSRPRQLKALLLDQSAIAGLGNIYCDEALWAAELHPLTIASTLGPESVDRLWREMRRVLRSAIRAGGSTLRDYRTADGGDGGFQRRHRVYGREGLPCPRCGTAIRRSLAAGRSSHHCPRCQRRRAHRPATKARPRRVAADRPRRARARRGPAPS